MWHKLNLKTRIYLALAILLAISLTGGLIMIWYTYQTERLLIVINEENLNAYQSAEALAISLVNQKGFVSYYFMDGDPDWLRQLGEYRQIFKERLKEARYYADSQNEKDEAEKGSDKSRPRKPQTEISAAIAGAIPEPEQNPSPCALFAAIFLQKVLILCKGLELLAAIARGDPDALEFRPSPVDITRGPELSPFVFQFELEIVPLQRLPAECDACDPGVFQIGST